MVQNKASKMDIQWNQDCLKAFEVLKDKLCSSPTLSFPTKDGLFILDTDASFQGMGAVLSQVQDGEEKVISYASKKFSNSQVKYCITRKELLSVYTFVKQFHHYLYGRKFKIRTDHKALTFMMNWKKPNTVQFCTWISELDMYDFTIEYRKGFLHTNADFMSRIDICEQCNQKHIEPKPRRHVKLLNDIEDDKPIFVRAVNSAKKKMLGKNELIQYFHETFGHPSHEATYELLKRYHKWDNMETQVKMYVNSCNACAERKIGRKLNAENHKFTAQQTFDVICLDIVGPVTPVNNYRYILGVIDVFSRYVKYIPLKSINAKTIVKKIFINWISYFGIPKRIHSDNGTQFHSELMKEFCTTLGIKRSFSSPYYHKGNGVIERSFRTMEDMIYTTARTLKINWVDALPLVEMSMRNRRVDGSKHTHEIVFGSQMNLYPSFIQDQNLDCSHYAEHDIVKYLDILNTKRKCINENRILEIGNVENKITHNLKVGELVMVKSEGKPGISYGRYFGPCRILSVLPNNNLLLEYKGKQLHRNISQVKRYHGVKYKNIIDQSNKQDEVNQRQKLRKEIKKTDRFY